MNVKRHVMVVNLDPAAEHFAYPATVGKGFDYGIHGYGTHGYGIHGYHQRAGYGLLYLGE